MGWEILYSISEKFQIECIDGSVLQGYKLTEWGHTEAWGADYVQIGFFSDVSIFEMFGELINSNWFKILFENSKKFLPSIEIIYNF